MVDVVLELLKKGQALTLNEISFKSGINNIKKTQEVLDILVDKLEIYVTRKNKYSVLENSKMLKGEVMVLSDGNGYITLDNYEQVYITKRDLHCAKSGDIVAIEITNNTNMHRCGRVVKIKARENAKVVGELVIKKDKVYILPDSKKDYRIDYNGSLNNLVNGMKVVVELKDKLNPYTYDSRIIEVIGHKDDPNIDMLSILKSYKIEIDFPEEVKEEVNNIPDCVTTEDINECINHGGKDLRNERTVTIDGDDTKDYDDAVIIKKIGDYYNVKVPISNVSCYVGVDSNIFNNAVERGTSVYLPGCNDPMLPRKLSNGICSLNPDADRLALTFDLLIDNNGKIVDYSIYDSIINSKKRMTYSDVNSILEDNIIPDSYEDYVEDLKILEELHKIIRKNKIERGFIDFEILENSIQLDENGKSINVKLATRGVAEKIIEDIMVLVGEVSSRFLDEIKKDGHIYRIHGEPNIEKLSRLREYLTILKCDTSRLNDASAKNMQVLLNNLKDRKEYLIIARELLKCMQKAIYSTENIGHFALCSESTCQVTSPIRRAGDLLNHILIRENLYHISKGSLTDKKLAYLANRASVTERNAASCENEAKKMKMAEYMQQHIGDEYEGLITHINKYGFYVELPNLIEGFVDIKYFPQHDYIYDESKFALINRKTGKKYFLGDKVNVVVSGANKQERTINFELSSDLHQKVKNLK